MFELVLKFLTNRVSYQFGSVRGLQLVTNNCENMFEIQVALNNIGASVTCRPAPIMLKILPIILSRISQKILPITLLIITYYSNKILLTTGMLHAG